MHIYLQILMLLFQNRVLVIKAIHNIRIQKVVSVHDVYESNENKITHLL